MKSYLQAGRVSICRLFYLKEKMAKQQRMRLVKKTSEEVSIHRQTHRSAKHINAKTENQANYLAAIRDFTLTFGVGPAGTGKTYLATASAANMFLSGRIEKIVLTRPAVEAGESLGFLPGEIEEKFDPYFQPFRDALEQFIGKEDTEYHIKKGNIVATPIAYLRGRTFRNSFVILDEAQNTTPGQMKMFLTRLGENSKIVVNGDPDQIDIKGPSGLIDAVKKLSRLKDCETIEFTIDDVVRHDLVGQIIRAYSSK